MPPTDGLARDTESVKEESIEAYYERAVKAHGGVTRRIIYRGRKGCADHLTGFPFTGLHLVELKRPVGGIVSIQQREDAKHWIAVNVAKHFLHTRELIDTFLIQHGI